MDFKKVKKTTTVSSQTVQASQIQAHRFHLWLVSSVDSSASSPLVSTPKSAQPSSN